MDTIDERVKSIIADVLIVNREDLKDSDEFMKDLGADSLDMVELTMELEREFEIEIPDEEIQHIDTVGKAVKYIEEHSH